MTHAATRGRCHSAGFTLVELAVVAVLASLLAAITVPVWAAHLQRARRADAVAALTRVQLAQAQHHSHNGLYAWQLVMLKGTTSGVSQAGHYDIRLDSVSADGYTATARARDDSVQKHDDECRELRLLVRGGMVTHEPSRRCWNL
jgi:type IV pilus assembly protein PilE